MKCLLIKIKIKKNINVDEIEYKKYFLILN